MVTNWLTGTVPDVRSEVTRTNPGMNPVRSVPETEAPPTPEVLPPPTVVSSRNLRTPISETGKWAFLCDEMLRTLSGFS